MDERGRPDIDTTRDTLRERDKEVADEAPAEPEPDDADDADEAPAEPEPDDEDDADEPDD